MVGEIFVKYLKITFCIFAISLVARITGVSAWASYVFNDEIYSGTTVTLPTFSAQELVAEQVKNTNDEQFVMIGSCKDTITKDKRAAEGLITTVFLSIGFQDVSTGKSWFGEDSKLEEPWFLYLRSTKFLPTTAKCTGLWAYESTPGR